MCEQAGKRKVETYRLINMEANQQLERGTLLLETSTPQAQRQPCVCTRAILVDVDNAPCCWSHAQQDPPINVLCATVTHTQYTHTYTQRGRCVHNLDSLVPRLSYHGRKAGRRKRASWSLVHTDLCVGGNYYVFSLNHVHVDTLKLFVLSQLIQTARAIRECSMIL